MIITERDKVVLQGILEGWAKGGVMLPGDVAWSCVDELVSKFGLERPQELQEIMDGTLEKRIMDRYKAGDEA
jgi:hypothetical protein